MTGNALIQSQIDVEGLTIAVTSSQADSADDGDSKAKKSKAKSKSRAEARELILDAHLRLKAGMHYGLIGRNGTGKSSMLIKSPPSVEYLAC